jgi:hypothetical protein
MRFQINKFEKAMVAIFVVIVISIVLNPPWAYFHPETGKFVRSLGERFIFDGGPEPEAQIHFSMLLYQIFVLGLLLVLLAFFGRFLCRFWRSRSKNQKE